MPRVIVIGGLVLLGVLIVGAMIQGSPADQRLVDLATHHAAQQASQNERLADLQKQWQSERSDLYQQRDLLESDRRQLAVDRVREPIIAQSILQVGTLALVLVPLTVCLLLLRRSQEPDEGDAIAETLVSDLLSAQPLLFTRELPAPDSPAARLGQASDEPSPHHQEEPPTP